MLLFPLSQQGTGVVAIAPSPRLFRSSLEDWLCIWLNEMFSFEEVQQGFSLFFSTRPHKPHQPGEAGSFSSCCSEQGASQSRLGGVFLPSRRLGTPLG